MKKFFIVSAIVLAGVYLLAKQGRKKTLLDDAIANA
jgi:hypothetical protein